MMAKFIFASSLVTSSEALETNVSGQSETDERVPADVQRWAILDGDLCCATWLKLWALICA